jgi:hypothetical protein
MVDEVRETCRSRWKEMFYKGLVSRHTPLGVTLLVVASHYVSCNHQSQSVQTPFHSKFPTVPVSVANETVVPLVVVTVAPRDPVSLIYDALMFAQDRVPPTMPPPSNETSGSEGVEEAIETLDLRAGLVQVCAMHAMSLGAFVALWLPTTYMNFSTRSSAVWTVGSISFACFATSVGVCMIIYRYVPRLGLCLAMHLTTHLLRAHSFLVERDASVPVYRPVCVARGLVVAHGVLLCYIAHAGHAIACYDTTDFYMNHLWAVGITGLVKQLLLAPVVLLVGMTVTPKLKSQ